MCRLDSLSALEEDGVETGVLDVTSQPSIEAYLARITASAGPLHILINNAGTPLLLPSYQPVKRHP